MAHTRATRHKAGSPFLCFELRTCVELGFMGDVVVPRPFESLLLDPGLGLTGRGELLHRDKVVLIPDVGKDMNGKVG
jgi:hypothetical protein